MPNGTRWNIGANSRGDEGVSHQVRTDNVIQTDPGPDRIKRILFANDMGYVTDDKDTFHLVGNNDNYDPIGHTSLTKVIYRAPAGISGPASSDNEQIDAFSAATPLPSM